jgi:hypothetical protein
MVSHGFKWFKKNSEFQKNSERNGSLSGCRSSTRTDQIQMQQVSNSAAAVQHRTSLMDADGAGLNFSWSEISVRIIESELSLDEAMLGCSGRTRIITSQCIRTLH